MEDGFVEFGDRAPARIKRDMERDGWTVTRARPRSGMYVARKGGMVARGWDLWALATDAAKREWGG